MRSKIITGLGKLQKGFTIIELIVVIVIIGILSTIVIVSYNSWKQTTAVAQLKSDLGGAVSAMEDYRNYNNGYPTDINALNTFAKSSGVNVYGGSRDGGSSYCIYASSSQFSNLYYYIDSSDDEKDAQIGTCSPMNLTATAVSDSVIDLSWDAIEGATNYILQRDVNSSFSGATTIATQAGLTFSSTGLSALTMYYYRVKATVLDGESNWSTAASTTTFSIPPSTPSAPSITVAPSGTNILATITPVTCAVGTIQYGIRSRTDDGTWSSYSAWSSTLTASQAASDGVKYGYQAQARCYVDDTAISLTATGTEGTYIDPITTPAARTLTRTNSGSSSTWSWNATSCPSGTSVNYTYRYTTSYGYDSQDQYTTGTSLTFATNTADYTYTVTVQTKCYNTNISSAWSAPTSLTYRRAFFNILVVGGGGAGAPNLSGGGGAGGYRYYTSPYYYLPGSSVPVVVGAGGGHSGSIALNGGNSFFDDIVAYGGGKASQRDSYLDAPGGGAYVGSGGGSCGYSPYPANGLVPNGGVTTSGQGSNGGGGFGISFDFGAGNGGGGGGGAGSAGSAGSSNTGGNGGAGIASTITGSTVYYGGGGGGGSYYNGGWGGLGGGGNGDGGDGSGGWGGTAGTPNTGGGGGGCFCQGGSGVVIVSYPTGSAIATGGTITTSGGYTIHKFTGNGTFVVTG